MKKKIFALCAIMLLASGCGKVPKLENGKEAIVTFKDGEKISVDDFYELIKNEYGLNSLISMVDKYICETEFEDYKDTASKNADALINSLKEQYGSEDKLLEALQGSGYNTIDAYKDYAYLSYLQSHAIEEYAKTKITDKEIENYYKNDAIGDMEINHILITSNVKKDATDDEKKAAQDETKKKANEVIDKLNTAKKNGENITEAFTKLAKEYSEDDSNKDKGGALGKINYGSLSSKYDELVKAAKSLKDGEYSTSVITTELGYHVILKVKTYEKDTLENLKDSIKETLAEKYIKNNQSSIGLNALQHYRKEYKMEIQDDEMKKQYSNYIQNALLTIQQNNSSK
jgi:foldase protein prsA